MKLQAVAEKKPANKFRDYFFAAPDIFGISAHDLPIRHTTLMSIGGETDLKLEVQSPAQSAGKKF